MKSIYRLILTSALLTLLLALASAASAEFEIKQWSIASGGGINATGGDWTLSGTIGQWEATEARALSGGGWQLTGGFWGMSLEELSDFLFRDRFEGPSRFQQVENLQQDSNES